MINADPRQSKRCREWRFPGHEWRNLAAVRRRALHLGLPITCRMGRYRQPGHSAKARSAVHPNQVRLSSFSGTTLEIVSYLTAYQPLRNPSRQPPRLDASIPFIHIDIDIHRIRSSIHPRPLLGPRDLRRLPRELLYRRARRQNQRCAKLPTRPDTRPQDLQSVVP